MRMLTMLPLLGLAVLAYVAASWMQGADMVVWLGSEFHTITNLPSGGEMGLEITNGDLFVLVGLFLLAMEIIKSTNTKGFSMANHGFSMLVFVIALFLFLTVEGYATSVFLMLLVMTLVDVMGMMITIVTARRDIGLGGFDAG